MCWSISCCIRSLPAAAESDEEDLAADLGAALPGVAIMRSKS